MDKNNIIKELIKCAQASNALKNKSKNITSREHYSNLIEDYKILIDIFKYKDNISLSDLSVRYDVNTYFKLKDFDKYKSLEEYLKYNDINNIIGVISVEYIPI
jgi:hypothetical protein